MDKGRIHIVMEIVGQYEDRHEYPVGAFLSREKAETYVKRNNEYYAKLTEDATSIDFDVSTKKDEAFLAFLGDTKGDEYVQLVLSATDFDDGEDGCLFDWDEYHDMEIDFNADKELVRKYLRRVGLTDEQLAQVDRYDEYESYGLDGVPYQYISEQEIKILD